MPAAVAEPRRPTSPRRDRGDARVWVGVQLLSANQRYENAGVLVRPISHRPARRSSPPRIVLGGDMIALA